MAVSLTTRAKLRKPSFNHPRPATGPTWDVHVNANSDAIEAANAIGALAVTPADQTAAVWSASLNVAVAAGKFRKADGTEVSYAGTASQAMTTASTNYLYLTDAGVLTVNTSGYPAATNLVTLATVVAGASTITSITDDRVPYLSFGATATPAPGGSTTQVQFNDAGVLAGDAGLTYNKTTDVLTAVGFAGSGASLTALVATNLATGTVPTARLGSGTANSTTFLRGDSTWVSVSGSGTVTSVALTVPADLSVSGSPVTTSGTLAITRSAQSGNKVLASPLDGSSAAPAYRVLVAADVPNLDTAKITTGTLSTARLGSGTADNTTFLRGDQTWAVPSGGGGGAPTGASYLTLGTDATLTAERVLTAGTAISLTDGGAGSTLTVANTGVTSLTGTSNRVTVSGSTGAITLSGPQDLHSGASPTFATVTATTFSGSGASLTTLNASNLSSGTVPTARLGSGTADNTTFLRGDQTYAVPSASGVSSITGTSNQVIASASTGAVTLSLPQSIGTGSSPTFGGLTLSGGLTLNADATLANGTDLVLGTGTGTKIGTSEVQKLGFYDAAPIIRPEDPFQEALTDSTGGSAGTTISDVGSSFDQSTLNNNLASIVRLLNQLRADLVALGLIKGSGGV